MGLVLTVVALAVGNQGQAPAPPPPPGLAAITERDVRRDMFALASDSFRGREAGTPDELRASMWIADRAREAGLTPAGDDGTFFQFWSIRRTRLAPTSEISIGNHILTLGVEAVVTQAVDATLDLPLVYVERVTDSALAGTDLAGKAVVALLRPPTRPVAANVSLRGFRYANAAIREMSQTLFKYGARAVLLVADAAADSGWDFASANMVRGRYALDTGVVRAMMPGAPVIWVRPSSLSLVQTPGQRLNLNLRVDTFTYPSVNIVGRVKGSDPKLKDEYVVYSSHQDHDGVRYTVDGDSIWNGADDNASTSVALLAIARALHQHPGKRSALFVWHGAEERGLLGSRWFVMHPTVPLQSMVAVLNGDMIGRNSPDSAALLGVQPPHRNSPALVAMALNANARVTKFVLDTTWDRPTHPEGWYFRSDHLPYARAGVPALFFTTLLHPDYHTPRDNPSGIDIAKLTRMTKWMYATGWAVSQAVTRPAVDTAFHLER
jgi:hypothetical protein